MQRKTIPDLHTNSCTGDRFNFDSSRSCFFRIDAPSPAYIRSSLYMRLLLRHHVPPTDQIYTGIFEQHPSDERSLGLCPRRRVRSYGRTVFGRSRPIVFPLRNLHPLSRRWRLASDDVWCMFSFMGFPPPSILPCGHHAHPPMLFSVGQTRTVSLLLSTILWHALEASCRGSTSMMCRITFLNAASCPASSWTHVPSPLRHTPGRPLANRCRCAMRSSVAMSVAAFRRDTSAQVNLSTRSSKPVTRFATLRSTPIIWSSCDADTAKSHMSSAHASICKRVIHLALSGRTGLEAFLIRWRRLGEGFTRGQICILEPKDGFDAHLRGFEF